MKNTKLALLTVLALCAALVLPVVCCADTEADVDDGRQGRFWVYTVELTADATGGAVTNYTIDLSKIWNDIRLKPYFFYMVRDDATDGCTSGEITITEKMTAAETAAGKNAKTIFTHTGLASGSDYYDAAEDLPNYWPVTRDLHLSVENIGANNRKFLDLIFTE